tara:strand:- start:23 stop:583 length:561 start_codon:yes stop_codon:yes gene_type:complete
MVDAYSTKGDFSFGVKWDWREADRAIATMDATASEVMAEAIKDAMMEEMANTQRYIRDSVPVRQRYMGFKTSNSLIVEEGRAADGLAEVRFGSDPIDSGGVEGSRGGKIAAMLQGGVEPFAYPFTFKTIKNSPGWGTIGGGFINAKTGDNMVHPGFASIGWLDFAADAVQQNLLETLEMRLQEAWG